MKKIPFGMKATRENDIITFENGQAFDLNQPLEDLRSDFEKNPLGYLFQLANSTIQREMKESIKKEAIELGFYDHTSDNQ